MTAFWGAMTVRAGILRFGAAKLAVLLGSVPSVSPGTIDGAEPDDSGFDHSAEGAEERA